MENTFVANSVTPRDSHTLSHQPLKPTMAVNSLDYNHKLDGHPNNMSGGGEMSGVTHHQPTSGNDSLNHDSITVNVVSMEPTRQDIRLQPGAVAQKMKELENMDVHRSSSVGLPSMPMANQKPKKGSFQITNVINRKQQELDTVDHANEDADSIGDDFDETNTEDLSSEIMDTSKMTDIDQDPSSEDTVQSLVVEDHMRGSKSIQNSLPPIRDRARQESGESTSTVLQNQRTILESEPVSSQPIPVQDSKEDNDDSNFGATRFRIVKLSNERFMRGRWSCYDYQDSERTSREKSNEDLGSGNSSAASSVHYVPGVDDPTKNPFTTTSSTSTVYADSSSMTGTTLAPDVQLGHSVSQITNGDYTTQQSGIVLGGGESSGAHEMSSSIVQPMSAVSLPISSNHTGPGYTTQAGSTGPTSQLPQDFNKEYLNQSATPAQSPSQTPQSIPQKPSVTVSQNATSIQSTGPTDALTDTASSKPTANTLGDFNVTSAGQSNNPSPDNVQGIDFRQTDNMYPPSGDDQNSNVSDDDRLSEGGMTRALISQAGLTQPLLDMVQTMHYPLGANREEDERYDHNKTHFHVVQYGLKMLNICVILHMTQMTQMLLLHIKKIL